MTSYESMLEGKRLLRAGDLDGAEVVLREATDLMKWSNGKPTGAYALLGKVLLKKKNPSGALLAFERSLPDRDGFKGIISVCRAWAKEAATDREGALRQYNRALSSAWLYAHWCAAQLSLPAVSYDEQVAVWEAWRRGLAEQGASSYPFTYAEHGAPPDDKLLSISDYRALHELTFGDAR